MNDIKKDDEIKICPMCKKEVAQDARICPYCKSDLTVSGNIATMIWSIGVILTICITIPIIMFSCGMCSMG